VLTTDANNYFYRYWFPGFPWENAEHYLKRSPISLVGNVTTPTMVITGEEDYRTPISESEQYYQALKLRKVEAVLARVPGEPHGVSQRPSHQIASVAATLNWFETHKRSMSAKETAKSE
jgi:acylaminoacyl-peptidase